MIGRADVCGDRLCKYRGCRKDVIAGPNHFLSSFA